MKKQDIVQIWKDPFNRPKNFKNDSPVGDIFEELSDDDLYMAGGGDVDPNSLVDPGALSRILGNKGAICTYTLECTYSCNV